jgi:hypothetical protein
MTRQDGWEVIYGLEKGWGIACVSSLTAQPRFRAVSTIGYESKVYDDSVYLGVSNIGFGLHARANGLAGQFNVQLGYGNFINDQDGIKVEITKPGDIIDTYYQLTYGESSCVNLGAAYALYPSYNYYGHYSYFSLFLVVHIDKTIHGYSYFGHNSYGKVNVNYALRNNISRFGYSVSVSGFYEPPYYIAVGFESKCAHIVTENFVRLLEEGELSNDYIFATENGDPDLSRPHDGVSIESYPYAHNVRGECW